MGRDAGARSRSSLRLAARFDVIVCVDYRGIGVAALAAGRLLGLAGHRAGRGRRRARGR